MASSNASTTSSGYTIQTSTNINPNYRCYWLNSCQGNHELRSCSHWREELRGKLGIYYSSNGMYRRFSRDNLSGVNLEHNPTGCTTVHLLIYTIRSDGMKEILFGLSNRRENHDDSTRRPLLSFPFSKPCKRREPGLNIARRAFKWISDDETIARQVLKSHFLFQHANVIYPWYVTNEQANLLTNNFQANEELISLHWFPLTSVLECLPEWKNFLTSQATENELAQHEHIDQIGIQLGEYHLWSVTASCLLCIREYIPGGFETFLIV
ncbi:hypothetical protein I4U23_012259 [Adineta vaga]|nr:hypothetical protein I4U23_012259 [Adineta vaga]